MAQPEMARITCSICNGWYNSQRELRDHLKTVHRRFVPEQTAPQLGGGQPNCLDDHLGTEKEEWAKLSIRLRERVQTHFNREELDIIDRFILLASQGSVFD